MKSKLILLTFFIIFSACSKQTEKTYNASKQDYKESPAIRQDTKINGSARSKDETKDDKIKILNFDKNNLPDECKFNGYIVEGARWMDNNGENILLITQTDIHKVNNDIRDQYLYAYLYIKNDKKVDLLWQINDHVESYCDVEAKYIPGTIEVLDIDNDGTAENAFIYKLDSRCDVSPLPIKLMMHSGVKKLVIRGDTKVDIGNEEIIGGKKSFDDAFNSAPDSFKEFASKKWDKFMRENKNP